MSKIRKVKVLEGKAKDEAVKKELSSDDLVIVDSEQHIEKIEGNPVSYLLKRSKEMSETIQIGKWNVPKKLYDDYVKFRMFADSYALGKVDSSRTVPMLEEERRMRWLLCVQKVMQLHREICKAINVPYSEESDDDFYITFKRQTDESAEKLRKLMEG